MLLKGANVLKYGRKGKPHTRRLWLAPGKDHILWRSIAGDGSSNEAERQMRIEDVVDLALGCSSTEVMLKNSVPKEFN